MLHSASVHDPPFLAPISVAQATTSIRGEKYAAVGLSTALVMHEYSG